MLISLVAQLVVQAVWLFDYLNADLEKERFLTELIWLQGNQTVS